MNTWYAIEHFTNERQTQRLEARRAASAAKSSAPARRPFPTQVRTLLSAVRTIATKRLFGRTGSIAPRRDATSEA